MAFHRRDRAGMAVPQTVDYCSDPRVSKPHQLGDALRALQIKLTSEEIAALESLTFASNRGA